MFERYSFVALTSTDLVSARAFWADLLGCSVTESRGEQYFVVDVGGLRLCVDRDDGRTHRAGSTDPTIGLKVASVAEALAELQKRGLRESSTPVETPRGAYVIIHDPDGRSVILTAVD